LQRFDLEDFKYNQVNMTAFRIVDSDNEEVQRVLHEMESISALGRAILNQSQVIKLIKF
jgi:ionotropic kainate glutamate receptor 2